MCKFCDFFMKKLWTNEKKEFKMEKKQKLYINLKGGIYYKMKKFSFTRKVSLLLAAFAVCIMATCFTLPVQAATPVLTQYAADEDAVAFASSQSLGSSVSVSYSTTPAFNTGVSTVTATYYTTQGGKYIYVLNKTLTAGSIGYIKYGTTVLPVVTAPKAPTTLQQTNAGKGTITATWPASAGATGYDVYVGTTNSSSTWTKKATVTTTSYTISGLNSGALYYVAIFPNKSNGQGFVAEGNGVGKYMLSGAGKATGLAYSDQIAKQNYYEVSWKSAGVVDGYEIYVYNKTGKKVAAYTTTGYTKTYCGFKTSKIKNKAFKFKVRSYVTLDNGNKAYSAWSSTKVVVPYAYISSAKALGNQKIQLKWSKVSGATSYTVYKASSATGKYKKVATVKKGTTYTVSKVPYYKYTYFCVKANGVKVGSKKYNTTTLKEPDWYRIYLSKRYY